jgi:uncharacterized membrane protein YgcG
MRKILLALLLILLPTLASVAQDEVEVETGSLIIVNDDGLPLDITLVEQAAQNLVNQHKADIAIYLVNTGNAEDFTQRLSSDGLGGDFSANASTLGIYVAVTQPYSEIRAGTNFDRIDMNELRTNTLNPLLREANYTQAFINTLNVINEQMSNPAYGAGYYFRFILTSPYFWGLLGVAGVVFALIRLGLTRTTTKDLAPRPGAVGNDRFGANTRVRKPNNSGGRKKS